MVELTQSGCVMLTPLGKANAEKMAKDFKAYVDKHPEALADDASDDVH